MAVTTRGFAPGSHVSPLRGDRPSASRHAPPPKGNAPRTRGESDIAAKAAPTRMAKPARDESRFDKEGRADSRPKPLRLGRMSARAAKGAPTTMCCRLGFWGISKHRCADPETERLLSPAGPQP